MAPYVGDIRIFAGSFAPADWAFCDGQALAIADFDSLFTLIGTRYGGNGETTFNLPDLRGRLPVHVGTNFALGQKGGVETVTLSTQQMPAHAHGLQASSSNASSANAGGNVLSTTPTYTPYFAGAANTLLAAGAMGPTGGSQPHPNMQPFLCINYIIALFGVFPT